MIPIEKILSETDAPYVAPMPHRGKRNEPAFVIEVVKKLAELKNISTDRMAAQIRENAKRIFGV
jgi:TatD DNase family protein